MLKEANLIKEEKYSMKPSRNREKAMGFMWQSEIKVTTKDDLHFEFFFWHHCHNDTGGNWYPSQEMLDSMWRDKWIPQERLPTAKLVDATWYRLYVGDHIYVSKKGFFTSDKRRDAIEESIIYGTWNQDEDLWLLI